MMAGALLTCVAVFLASGIYGTARSIIRYRRVSPYERYLRTLRRIV